MDNSAIIHYSLFIIHCIALTFFGSGCGGEKTLHVGIDGEYYPWMTVDAETGRYSGFDCDFAEAACARLGMKPVFTCIDWDRKRELLERGEIDCVWSGFTTTGREKDYEIVGPYFENHLIVVARAAAKVNGYADLARCIVVHQKDTMAEAVLAPGGELEKLGVKPKRVIPHRLNEACHSYLLNGVADALVTDVDYALSLVMQSKGTLAVVPGPPLHPESIGIGLKKGNRLLARQLGYAIDELVRDGTARKLVNRYFGGNERWLWRK